MGFTLKAFSREWLALPCLLTIYYFQVIITTSRFAHFYWSSQFLLGLQLQVMDLGDLEGRKGQRVPRELNYFMVDGCNGCIVGGSNGSPCACNKCITSFYYPHNSSSFSSVVAPQSQVHQFHIYQITCIISLVYWLALSIRKKTQNWASVVWKVAQHSPWAICYWPPVFIVAVYDPLHREVG